MFDGLKIWYTFGPIMYFQSSTSLLIGMIPCRPHKGVRIELTWMELAGDPALYIIYTFYATVFSVQVQVHENDHMDISQVS